MQCGTGTKAGEMGCVDTRGAAVARAWVLLILYVTFARGLQRNFFFLLLRGKGMGTRMEENRGK